MLVYMIAAATAILGLILVTLWVVLYQLVKQQGRILLRQDGIEHRLMLMGLGAANQGVAAGGMEGGHEGLDVGTPVPPFRLADLTGRKVALEDLQGSRVLLVHWNPQCGFCDLIAPALARLQPDLRQRGVQVLLLAHGGAEANGQLAEKHGLEFPILLQKDGAKVPEVFRKMGTPVAYLLDEQGKVARPLAVGAERVPELAREAAGVAPGARRCMTWPRVTRRGSASPARSL